MPTGARAAIVVGFVTVLGLALPACRSPEATNTQAPPAHELSDAPAWVHGGCSRAASDDSPTVCGVGSMGRSRNPALARTTAIGRARTAVARSLEVKVEALLLDHQSTTRGGAPFDRAADDAQHVRDVSRQVTQLSLAGAETRAVWISPNGTVFALVELDADRFRASVAEMDQLGASLRAAIAERAGTAFADPDDEMPPGGLDHEPPLRLVTAAEAALPDPDEAADTPVWGRREDSPLGPQIVIRSPVDGGIYSDPFPIDIEFSVGRSGEPVDMSTLELEYKKVFGIDITSRVREYVKGTRIEVAAADLPIGRHRIQISIEDTGEHRSSRLLTVVVEN